MRTSTELMLTTPFSNRCCMPSATCMNSVLPSALTSIATDVRAPVLD